MKYFRGGRWIEASLTLQDPRLQESHRIQAASFAATAMHKGFDAPTAESLAELYIYRQIFPTMKSSMDSTVDTILQGSRGNNMMPQSTKKNTPG